MVSFCSVDHHQNVLLCKQLQRAQPKSLKGTQDHLNSSCHTTVADTTKARIHTAYKHFIADRSTAVEELNVYSNTGKFAEGFNQDQREQVTEE